jgi:hypothetical protein
VRRWQNVWRNTRRSPEPLPHCGFGDLKDPSFPPVAQGHSPRDLGGYNSVAATGTTFPLIPIVRWMGSSFQGKIENFGIPSKAIAWGETVESAANASLKKFISETPDEADSPALRRILFLHTDDESRQGIPDE